MKPKLSIYIFMALFASETISAQEETKSIAKVEYSNFLQISAELAKYRASRLISIETFNNYSTEKNTIILDTRSKKAFDEIHIKGAIHINFSDFTKVALAEVLPDNNTRILIYCNNNFESPRMALLNKMAPLALNIPTFINLYAYGYENIYELKEYLNENDKRVHFEQTNH